MYISITTCLVCVTLIFLSLFNLWQFGACNVFQSTCSTILDRVIPGWTHDIRPPDTRTWVPGQGWVVEYHVSREERLRMLERIDFAPFEA